MRTITPLLLILVTMFISCRKTGLDIYDEEMDKMEKLLQDRKTPTRTILLKLGQIKSEYENFSVCQKMRFELLHAEVQDKASVRFTSDKEMKEAVEYYRTKGTEEQKMKACYLLGCVYRDMHETPRALEWMERALRHANTDKIPKRTVARIYSQMSRLYIDCMMIPDAIEATKKGANIFLLAKDSVQAYKFYGHLHHAYHIIGKLDSAIIVCKTASDYFIHTAQYKDAATYDGYNAYYHIVKRDFKNARFLLNRCIEHSDTKENAPTPTLCYVQGMCLLDEGHLQDAEICFRRCLAKAHDAQNKMDAVNGLRNLYSHQNTPDSVIKYADMAIRFNRLLFDKELSKNIQKTKLSYDFNHNLFLVKSLETQLKLLNIYYYLFWIACLVIMLLAMAFVLERNAVFKAKSLIEKQKMENVSHEKRNKQLSIELKSLYKESQITDKATIKKNQLSLMKQTEIYLSLVRRSNKADSVLAANDWRIFYDKMNEIMPMYLHALQKYQLPKSKEMLCILLLLGFSFGQIKNLLGNPKINISTEKKRLLKKMFDLDGTPIDFDNHLKDI